eukprot:gene2232-17838_t
MRQSRNLSGLNSATGQAGHRHANGSAASADEENIPSPLRRASGKRRSRPFSGEFDYDAINHPLPKSPVSKKEGGITNILVVKEGSDRASERHQLRRMSRMSLVLGLKGPRSVIVD